MRWNLLILVALWSVNTFAQVHFENDREGESYYQGKSFSKHSKYISVEKAQSAFSGILKNTKQSQLCSLDILDHLRRQLPEVKKSHFHHVLNSLRDQGEIDDVVLGIFLQSWKVLESPVTYYPEDDSYTELLDFDEDLRLKKIELIETFSERAKTRCFEEAYRLVISELKKLDKKISDQEIGAIITQAYSEKRIDLYTYGRLQQLRREKADSWKLSLKDYMQKVQILRKQFPLRDAKEQSSFVTGKAQGSKESLRQRLYANYSYIQIALMGKLIQSLKTRLDSPKIEILVYDKTKTGVNEVMALPPMERFYFSLAALKTEMHELSINSYFGGQKPSYTDIMTAAYEINIVTAKEIDAVAKLEEIWSPKRTFWDKAQSWIRVASSVASILIPPPYGFIPSLALVVIEGTQSKKSTDNNREHSMFKI